MGGAGCALRLLEEHHNGIGVLELTATYDPGYLRFDSSAERLEVGAVWNESYTVAIAEGPGDPIEIERTDRWEANGRRSQQHRILIQQGYRHR
jgi:hypothetical protein